MWWWGGKHPNPDSLDTSEGETNKVWNVYRLPLAVPDGVFLNLAATCETITEAG